MVLSKAELIASLQNEVRLVVHLASKASPAHLDYRPSASQRSTLELIRYISMMGPTIIRWSLANTSDFDIWTKAEAASKERGFEQAKEAIAAQKTEYAELLSGLTDADFRAEVTDFDGNKTSRGAFLTNLVLAGCAAYRMQLFLNLKASSAPAINSSNLWSGMDMPTQA
ncbi:MAG TPA: hypothetical protein PLD86_03465 [Vicinamibacteria bacterium]|nr:hypothetical protein [Vicinamibacteria bacterium]